MPGDRATYNSLSNQRAPESLGGNRLKMHYDCFQIKYHPSAQQTNPLLKYSVSWMNVDLRQSSGAASCFFLRCGQRQTL